MNDRCPTCRARPRPAHACSARYINFEALERQIQRNPERFGLLPEDADGRRVGENTERPAGGTGAMSPESTD